MGIPAASPIYNDNDISGGRVASMVRMSMAGSIPVAGLLHAGISVPVAATAAQPNQAPGTINYSAGGVVAQGIASAAPSAPVGNLPVSGSNSGNNFGGVAQAALAAMAIGNHASALQPYAESPALGPSIPSNAAGAAGAPQSQQNICGAQLINNVSFTVAPSGSLAAGASVGTLTAAWQGQTASNYVLTLSTGQVLFGITLTNGATTCTTGPAVVVNGTPTVNAQVSQ